MNRGAPGSGHGTVLRLACGVSALCLLALFNGCGKATPVGGKAAADTLSTVDAARMGELVRAARGTVLVVNIWATWCPPCVAEMPEFTRFYNETKRADVTFLSVSANAPETIAGEVKPFIAKNTLPFPVCVLSNANPDTIGKATGAEVSGALPLTLVYDRTGKLQKMLEESITFDSLMALVKPLL